MLERPLQVNDLVKGASQRPNIGLLIVLVSSDDFGGHEVGRSQASLGEVGMGSQRLGDSEIPELNYVVCIKVNNTFVEEHVLSLNVAMQNILSVHEVNCDHELGHPGEDLIFWNLVALIPVLQDPVIYAPPLRVLHDDIQAILLDEALMIFDDCRSYKYLQQADFIFRVLLFLIIHIVEGDYLLQHISTFKANCS